MSSSKYVPLHINYTIYFFNIDSQFEEDDERFIGCWWLSFVIWAGVMLIGSIGMLFCPKHLPYYYEQKEKAQLEQKQAGVSLDKNRKKSANEIAKGL